MLTFQGVSQLLPVEQQFPRRNNLVSLLGSRAPWNWQASCGAPKSDPQPYALAYRQEHIARNARLRQSDEDKAN
jgi:hypothetical protein